MRCCAQPHRQHWQQYTRNVYSTTVVVRPLLHQGGGSTGATSQQRLRGDKTTSSERRLKQCMPGTKYSHTYDIHRIMCQQLGRTSWITTTAEEKSLSHNAIDFQTIYLQTGVNHVRASCAYIDELSHSKKKPCVLYTAAQKDAEGEKKTLAS